MLMAVATACNTVTQIVLPLGTAMSEFVVELDRVADCFEPVRSLDRIACDLDRISLGRDLLCHLTNV